MLCVKTYFHSCAHVQRTLVNIDEQICLNAFDIQRTVHRDIFL